jgi:AraC family transcriptional regulator
MSNSAVEPWKLLRQHLDMTPVLSGRIDAAVPMVAERYVFQKRRLTLPALPTLTLLSLLGGSTVSGQDRHGDTVDYPPTLSAWLPRACASEWTFSGPVDVAVFHFLDADLAVAPPLVAEPCGAGRPRRILDQLVNSLAREVCEEIRRGELADTAYVQDLANLMQKKLVRAMAAGTARTISASPANLSFVSRVTEWVVENLDGDLTLSALAARAGVSQSHLRHAFAAALGISPTRFVTQRRLQRARDLLAMTNQSIGRVAETCGFHSQNYLATRFKTEFGVTPNGFRRQLRRGAALHGEPVSGCRSLDCAPAE